jgi:hypothetical protein
MLRLSGNVTRTAVILASQEENLSLEVISTLLDD